MKLKLLFCVFLFIGILSFSCSKDNSEEFVPDDIDDTETPVVPDDPGDTDDEELDNNSQEYTFENEVSVVFYEGGATVDNQFEGTGVSIENTNGHVVITSTITDKELNYVLSGTISDGSLKIYGEKKFGLILNGVGITNSTGAAINIQCGKKVMLTIMDGTNNRLIDSNNYTYVDGEDMKATFFSEGNMEVSGNGTLEIRGKNKHAWCVDGSLSIASGDINIKEAVSDGIHTNDEIAISGGTLTIRSAGDAIDCESETEPVTITGGDISIITSGEKGHAITAGSDITVDTGGNIEITVYGNASKGIKPTGDLTITRGNITINTTGSAIWDSDDNDISSAAGIKCDGNLLVEDGTITILSTGQGGKGINVDGTLVINSGDISVTTTGDQFTYNRNYDTAAKAIKSDGNLTINGGNIKIRTSKTEAEGLESKAKLYINGGEIDIIAYDDCINASSHIEFTGGNVYCYSYTNDGVDSNGTLTISGGLIVSIGSSSPEEGFDCDNNRFSITGGTLVGTGGATSNPTANACTQNSLVYATSSTFSLIHIASSDGKEALTFALPVTYKQTTLLFSSSALESKTSYTIYTGGTISGGSDFHGLYTGATYTKGSAASTFTTSSTVTTIGTSNGPGGGR